MNDYIKRIEASIIKEQKKFKYIEGRISEMVNPDATKGDYSKVIFVDKLVK